MTRTRTWWLVFALGAAIVLGAMAWLTGSLMRLERAEARARAEARQQEALRLALWRMDSWLGSLLARESARPYFEYLAFYAQERAYTRYLNAIEPGDVLTPSPLLTSRDEFLPLHVQVNAAGEFTSPQAPAGNLRDLAEASFVDAASIATAQERLERLKSVTSANELFMALAEQEKAMLALSEQVSQVLEHEGPEPIAATAGPAQQSAQVAQSQKEYARRAEGAGKANTQQRWQAPPPQTLQTGELHQSAGAGGVPGDPALIDRPASVHVGPLVPVWIPAGAGGHSHDLLLLRMVRAETDVIVQGALLDWPRVKAELEHRVSDLFADPDIRPDLSAIASGADGGSNREPPTLLDDGASGGGQRTAVSLASIPAYLVPGAPLAAGNGTAGGQVRWTLLVAWPVVIGAVILAGLALHASILFGAKRTQFASAVTHDLRTPLTTFRMYSEMLADDMVPDEAHRKEYLRTLVRESGRLATLVENVLAYARLEDRRLETRRQSCRVSDLIARMQPALERRAMDAGMTLVIDISGAESIELQTDPDAVEQILHNLVDNACKYAQSATDRRIHLDARARGDGTITFTVRDHGPGVDSRFAGAIFRAFDRGAHGPGDTIPGVGLGLALARDLARALGGSLTLVPPQDGHGAEFVLELAEARGH